MKKTLLLAIILSALSCVAQVNTNNPEVTVKVYLTDQQVETLKYYKRIMTEVTPALTNVNFKTFAETNIVVSVAPNVADTVATRKQSIREAIENASDALLEKFWKLLQP